MAEPTLHDRRMIRDGRVDGLLDARILLADEVIIATTSFTTGKPKDLARLGGKVQGLHVAMSHIDEALRSL